MLNVLVRTVILYSAVVILMRLTGKRQIGQLELTELVTAFMISELAANPISNNSIPIAYGIIPAAVLVCLEVFLSFASIKSKRFARLLAGNALLLINKGKIDIVTMTRARITVEELASAVRCSGSSGLSEVEYAYLEPNGTISVIPKAKNQPITPSDLDFKVNEKGIEHIVVSDGVCDKEELKKIGFDEAWLEKTLKADGIKNICDVFYMSVNDSHDTYIVRRDNKK